MSLTSVQHTSRTSIKTNRLSLSEIHLGCHGSHINSSSFKKHTFIMRTVAWCDTSVHGCRVVSMVSWLYIQSIQHVSSYSNWRWQLQCLSKRSKTLESVRTIPKSQMFIHFPNLNYKRELQLITKEAKRRLHRTANSTGWSSNWHSLTWSQSSQPLMEPAIHCMVCRESAIISVLDHISPVYTFTSHFIKTNFNIILPSMPSSPKRYLPYRFCG
jgi:hypothetical protein